MANDKTKIHASSTDSVKPKRMSVSLTMSDVNKLDWLANTQQITQGEALRRAISTEKHIQESIQEDGKIFIEKPDGQRVQMIFR